MSHTASQLRDSESAADTTLTALGRVEPRGGLEGRMLARLRHDSLPVQRFYLITTRRTASALTLTTVVLFASVTFYQRHSRLALPYVPVRVSHQDTDSPVRAAGAVVAAGHPIHAAILPRTRRRLRTGRAQTSRVPLPHGVGAPAQLNLRAVPAH